MKSPAMKLRQRARKLRMRRDLQERKLTAAHGKPLRQLDYRRGHVVGAPPGLVEETLGESARVSVFRYNADEIEEYPNCDVNDAIALCTSEYVTWIDVVGVEDHAVLKALGKAFDLHPLALEDVTHVNQRTKVEDYGTFDFVVMKAVTLEPELRREQISLFLCDNAVITFQEREGDSFEPVRERLRLSKGRIRALKEDYLVYALVDAVVDSLYPAVEVLGDQLEALEHELLTRPTQGILSELHHIRQELLSLRKVTWPLRDTVNGLGRESHARVKPETLVFIRDTQDHVAQIIDMIETFREVAGGLIDLYLSSVSNRMNEIMGLLTIITTIFVPLSFLTGLYGMNFDTSKPGNMPELSLPYAYPILIGVMGALSVGLLAYFWKRGWLSWAR